MNYREWQLLFWELLSFSIPKHNQIQKERKRLAKHETITNRVSILHFLELYNIPKSPRTTANWVKLEPESVGICQLCQNMYFLNNLWNFPCLWPFPIGERSTVLITFKYAWEMCLIEYLTILLPLFRLTFIFLTAMIAWIFFIKQIDQRRANPPGRPPTCFVTKRKKSTGGVLYCPA